MPHCHIRTAGVIAFVSLAATSIAVAAASQTYSQKFTTVHPKTASGMNLSANNTTAVRSKRRP